MFSKIEKIVEWLLWQSRFMIIIAVIAAIISALVMVLIGTWDVILVLRGMFAGLGDPHHFEVFHMEALTNIVSSIDAYLIATVLLIFGIGLYELFISKIDLAEQDTRSSRILIIHDLDQLKEKIAKVIIMVLIVTFFKHALAIEYNDVVSLVYLSIGIFLIALSVFFMHNGHKVAGKEPVEIEWNGLDEK